MVFLGDHDVLDRGVVDSYRDLPQEHRPTLIHLSPPVSTIHPGDNARAATAASHGLPGRTECRTLQGTFNAACPCAESCAHDTGCATRKARRPIIGRRYSSDQGSQLRRTEGHTEALAPQDYAAECVGVGAVGHSVDGVTPVGA